MFTSICKYGVFGSSSPMCSVSSWGYVNCGLFNYFKHFVWSDVLEFSFFFFSGRSYIARCQTLRKNSVIIAH